MLSQAQMVGTRNLVEKLKKHRKELHKQYDFETKVDNLRGTGIEDYYTLRLFYDPLDYQSQKTFAILNYYKISYKRVMGNSLIGRATIPTS